VYRQFVRTAQATHPLSKVCSEAMPRLSTENLMSVRGMVREFLKIQMHGSSCPSLPVSGICSRVDRKEGDSAMSHVHVSMTNQS
jgi:hypothetical protein